jgi:hypothetical protein
LLAAPEDTNLLIDSYFSSDEFHCVARAKLGVGPTNDPPGLFRVCACNKSFDASVDSLHGLSCSLNKGSPNLCHDNIRDRLYQLIKRLNPGIQQTHLSMEFEVGQITAPGDNPKHVRTDIKYIKGADTFYINIAIVDPADLPESPNLLPRQSRRSSILVRKDKASALRPGQLSRTSPRKINHPLHHRGERSPWSLRPPFSSLSVWYKDLHPFPFFSEINLLCDRTAGRMLKTTRDRFQGLHNGVLQAPMYS